MKTSTPDAYPVPIVLAPRFALRRAAIYAATLVIVAMTLLLFARSASAQIPCSYEVAAVIQGPPGPNHESPTAATAISPDGRYVVGDFNFDAVGSNRAFCYDMQTSAFQILPLIDGTFTSTAWDVNNAGIVVGEIGGATGDWGFLFDLATGEYTLLPSLAGVGICRVTGINEAGTVCGTRTMTGPPNYPETAFIWTQKDGFTDFGVMNGPNSVANAIAEDGTVVGYTGGNLISASTRAFIWRNGNIELLPPIPGGTNSAASAVFDSNHIAIRGRAVIDGEITTKGFSYYNGELVDLGTLPNHARTFPRAFDGHGQMIGACATESGQNTGFLWRNEQIVSLHALTAPSTAAILNEPYGASASGAIVGQGTNQVGDTVGVVVTPILAKPGDTNCDNVVGVADLIRVITDWGPCAGCSADLDGDLDADIFDLLEVILNWG